MPSAREMEMAPAGSAPMNVYKNFLCVTPTNKNHRTNIKKVLWLYKFGRKVFEAEDGRIFRASDNVIEASLKNDKLIPPGFSAGMWLRFVSEMYGLHEAYARRALAEGRGKWSYLPQEKKQEPSQEKQRVSTVIVYITTSV